LCRYMIRGTGSLLGQNLPCKRCAGKRCETLSIIDANVNRINLTHEGIGAVNKTVVRLNKSLATIYNTPRV
ncbi:MAG: hypothetical protein QNK37_05585, partial [Acidobacteriota bacterium]|nr:hypothetical protein [Acidobacteriota bacterium]